MVRPANELVEDEAAVDALMRIQVSSSVRKAYTSQFFAQMPQLVGKFRINGPGSHTAEFGGIARHRGGKIAIFTINAAQSFKLTACSTPDASCRPLFGRLHVACWVARTSSVDM